MDAREALQDRFVRAIDLPAYLALHGFEPVTRRPDATGLVMTNAATGETMRLQKDIQRGGWTFVQVGENSERGTIIDFLRLRHGLTTEACLERLIACVEERRRDVPEAVQYRSYVHDKPDPLRSAQGEYLLALKRRHDATRMLARVGIRGDTLDEWRFGAMNTERDVGRAIEEPEQLWASRYRATDTRVVLTESPLDAISVEQARGDQRSCYLATGSRPDEDTRRRLAHILAEVPAGMSVVLAFGRDQRGRQLAEEIRALAPTVRMERLAPHLGSRWSSHVQFEQRHVVAMTRAKHQLSR